MTCSHCNGDLKELIGRLVHVDHTREGGSTKEMILCKTPMGVIHPAQAVPKGTVSTYDEADTNMQEVMRSNEAYKNRRAERVMRWSVCIGIMAYGIGTSHVGVPAYVYICKTIIGMSIISGIWALFNRVKQGFGGRRPLGQA